MKHKVIYTILIGIILSLVFVYVIRDYQARMIQYNLHVCEVYGKQSDCTTPLPTKAPQTTPEPSKTPLSVVPAVLSATKLESLVNEYRQAQNKPVLKHQDSLCPFALERATEAITDWSHDGFHEDSWKANKGYSTLGENLGRDWATETDLLNAWIHSPTHNSNMLDTWRDMCIMCSGIACSNIFGR
jgi:uncharacterized protein YkwD